MNKPNLMKKILILWSAVAVGFPGMAQATDDVLSLEEARATWESHTQGMATNYTFEYIEDADMSEFPLSKKSPFIVDIRDDMVDRVYSKDAPFDPPMETTGFPTIDTLFDMIEDALVFDSNNITVEYNEELGYPAWISIIYNETDVLDIQIPSLTPYTLLQNELEEKKALWESYDAASYEYTIQVFCFCMRDFVQPKRITVGANDEILSVIDIASGDRSDYIYDTISQLFQRVEESIAEFHVQILVDYDSEYGYPQSITTNPAYGLADAQTSISVANVTLFVEDPLTSEPTSAPGNPEPTKPTGFFNRLCNGGFFRGGPFC